MLGPTIEQIQKPNVTLQQQNWCKNNCCQIYDSYQWRLSSWQSCQMASRTQGLKYLLLHYVYFTISSSCIKFIYTRQWRIVGTMQIVFVSWLVIFSIVNKYLQYCPYMHVHTMCLSSSTCHCPNYSLIKKLIKDTMIVQKLAVNWKKHL